MSYGYYYMGSSVPGKIMPQMAFLNDLVIDRPVEIRPVIIASTPDTMPSATAPAIAETIIGDAKLTSAGARQQGYTGNQCTQCSSMRMKIAGHCEVCEECGSSSGCS